VDLQAFPRFPSLSGVRVHCASQNIISMAAKQSCRNSRMAPCDWLNPCKMYPLGALILTIFYSGTVVSSVAAFPTVTVVPLASAETTVPRSPQSPKWVAPIKGSLAGSNNAEDVPEFAREDEANWRQALPSPLNTYRNQSLQLVQCEFFNGDALDVFVIGTIHVSNDSPRDVRLLLETIRPDIIFLELCYPRFQSQLKQEEEDASGKKRKKEQSPMQNRANKQRLGLRRRLRKGRNGRNHGPFNKLEQFAGRRLKANERMLREVLDAKPFDEFSAAYEYWKEIITEQEKEETSLYSSTSPPMLVLGDRTYELTYARALEAMTKWERTKWLLRLSVLNPFVALLGFSAVAWTVYWTVFVSGFGGTSISVWTAFLITIMDRFSIEGLKEKNRSLLYETSDDGGDDTVEKLLLGGPCPDVLVRERDVFMACKLFQACLGLLTQEDLDNDDRERKKFRAVAVVGLAHVDGMSKFFSELVKEQNPNPEEHLRPLVKSKRLKLEKKTVSHMVEYSTIVSRKPDEIILLKVSK